MHEAVANLVSPFRMFMMPEVRVLGAFAAGVILGFIVDALAWCYVARRLRTRKPLFVSLGEIQAPPFGGASAVQDACPLTGDGLGYLLSACPLKLAFALSYSALLRGEWMLETAELLLFACILQFVSRTDAEMLVIPNGCMALASAARLPYLLYASVAGLMTRGEAVDCLVSALLVPALLLAVACAFDAAWGRDSIGGGDVKLYAVVGLHFGLSRTLAIVAASCAIAAGVHMIGKAGRRTAADTARGGRPQDMIPLGPWISLVAVAAMLLIE